MKCDKRKMWEKASGNHNHSETRTVVNGFNEEKKHKHVPESIKKRESKPATFTILKNVCIGLSLLLVVTLLIFIHFLPQILTKLNPHVHSCSVYVVDGEQTVWGILRSLIHFLHSEGFDNFSSTIKQFVKAEVMDMSPLVPIDPIRGKKLIMLGGGYLINVLEYFKRFKVDIYMLEDIKFEKQLTEGKYVTKFIGVENFGRITITDPEQIISLIKQSGLKFDGVFSLSEAQSPLVAKIANRFGLPGNPENASLIARNKHHVRTVMKKHNLRTPKNYFINSEADLIKAAEFIGFPAFLKPNFGVAAMFSARVDSLAQLVTEYRNATSQMIPDKETIYFYGTQMVLEELIFGAEVQVEFLLYKGKIVYHCFSSEYSPTRDFLVFPVNLTETQKQEMYDLASKTIHAIGLTDGAVHIEMFYTSTGPQIIEVNNRLSRGFLPMRFSHQLLFGGKLTDYFASVLFIALGYPPPVFERKDAPLHMSVFLDSPSKTGWETEGGCAAFFAPSTEEAIEAGRQWKQSLQNKVCHFD
jgi:predicted ATP-grasp superfamily ATP-dependent carboligase